MKIMKPPPFHDAEGLPYESMRGWKNEEKGKAMSTFDLFGKTLHETAVWKREIAGEMTEDGRLACRPLRAAPKRHVSAGEMRDATEVLPGEVRELLAA